MNSSIEGEAELKGVSDSYEGAIRIESGIKTSEDTLGEDGRRGVGIDSNDVFSGVIDSSPDEADIE